MYKILFLLLVLLFVYCSITFLTQTPTFELLTKMSTSIINKESSICYLGVSERVASGISFRKADTEGFRVKLSTLLCGLHLHCKKQICIYHPWMDINLFHYQCLHANNLEREDSKLYTFLWSGSEYQWSHLSPGKPLY